MLVIKADGRRERFNKLKIINSLQRVGIAEAQAKTMASELQSKFPGVVQSDYIFQELIGRLSRIDSTVAARYNLRRAIMHLGPSGYPFEKYVGRILAELGYETKTNLFLKGNCVMHEVDVIARKERTHYLIECKYHNTPGARSDVKVALYSWARFVDIRQRWEKEASHYGEQHVSWLITNTRFTKDAIDYGRCMGVKITGWGYPLEQSLEDMISQSESYPINIFPQLGSALVHRKLFDAKIVLASDLLRHSLKELQRKTGLKAQELATLQNEARKLCPNC